MESAEKQALYVTEVDYITIVLYVTLQWRKRHEYLTLIGTEGLANLIGTIGG